MSAVAVRARLRSRSGQSTIEFAGTAVLLVFAALLAWQLALIGWTAVSTANAVRTAARLYSRGATAAEAQAAGTKSLFTSSGAHWTHQGNTWTLVMPIPIVLPGVHLTGKDANGKDIPFAINRDATIPRTG